MLYEREPARPRVAFEGKIIDPPRPKIHPKAACKKEGILGKQARGVLQTYTKRYVEMGIFLLRNNQILDDSRQWIDIKLCPNQTGKS